MDEAPTDKGPRNSSGNGGIPGKPRRQAYEQVQRLQQDFVVDLRGLAIVLCQQRHIEVAAARGRRASRRRAGWRRLKGGNEPPGGSSRQDDQARDHQSGANSAKPRSRLASRPVMPPPRQPQQPEEQDDANGAEYRLSPPELSWLLRRARGGHRRLPPDADLPRPLSVEDH